MRVNNGTDLQSKALGGDSNIGYTGTTSSAPTSASVTDSAATWPVNAWLGHIVAMGSAYGVVISNTATVLTIDMWHSATAPESAAATPGSGLYLILPGQAPAWWMGISVASAAPAATDTFLNNSGSISELWATGGGLNRTRATFAHTTGATSYTLTKQFTMNSNDGTTVTLNKIGIFASQVTAAPSAASSGPMLFETAIPSPPTLVPGDQVTFTETVTLS